jgi:hypothetical protein
MSSSTQSKSTGRGRGFSRDSRGRGSGSRGRGFSRDSRGRGRGFSRGGDSRGGDASSPKQKGAILTIHSQTLFCPHGEKCHHLADPYNCIYNHKIGLVMMEKHCQYEGCTENTGLRFTCRDNQFKSGRHVYCETHYVPKLDVDTAITGTANMLDMTDIDVDELVS